MREMILRGPGAIRPSRLVDDVCDELRLARPPLLDRREELLLHDA
jgi:hypothetical protein